MTCLGCCRKIASGEAALVLMRMEDDGALPLTTEDWDGSLWCLSCAKAGVAVNAQASAPGSQQERQ